MKKYGYAALIAMVVGIIGLIYSFNTGRGFAFGTVKVNEEKSIDDNTINKVEIDTSSTDVFVRPSDNEKISIHLKGKTNKKIKKLYKLSTENHNGVLKINVEKKSKLTVGVLFDDVNLEVKLPPKMYKTFSVNVSSGDLDMHDIDVNELQIDSQSGDVDVNQIQSKNLFSISSKSGDVKMENVHAKKVNLEVRSGDITAKKVVSDEASIDSSSGNVDLLNVDGDITASVQSGDITIDNDKLTNNITADSSSGDVEIHFSKPSNVALDYKGSSGDGEVHLDGMLYEEKSENRIKGKLGNGKYLIKVRTSSGDFVLK